MVVTWKRLLRVRRATDPADAAVAPSAPREEGGDDVGGEEDEEGEEGAEEDEDEGMSSDECDAWATPEAARGEGAPETLVTSTKSPQKAPDPPAVVEAQEGAQLASDAKPGSDDDDDDDDIWEDGPATAAVAPPAHIPAASRADDVFGRSIRALQHAGQLAPAPAVAPAASTGDPADLLASLARRINAASMDLLEQHLRGCGGGS